MKTRTTRTEKFFFGEFQVQPLREQIPRVNVKASDIYSTINMTDVVSTISRKEKGQKDPMIVTLNSIQKSYAKRQQYQGLTPSEEDMAKRVASALVAANKGNFTINDGDFDISFAVVMFSTWMRGSNFSNITEIIPDLMEKIQRGLPISFYNAMAKTGPLESEVNTPDLGHLLHMARLGKLLDMKGNGPKEVQVIDEYDYLGRHSDLFGTTFDNSAYRETFLAMAKRVCNVSFLDHPAIKMDVFNQNMERFKADGRSEELVRNRAMLQRGYPEAPPDNRLIPVTAYLEGSKPKPTDTPKPFDTLHTTLIKRKGGLFIGLTEGFTPIHGVPLIYQAKKGVRTEEGQGSVTVTKTEIVREADLFNLSRAVEESGLSMSVLWTNLDPSVTSDRVTSNNNPVGRVSYDQFMAYILHPKSETPTTEWVQQALSDAMREKSATASSGVHEMSHFVSSAPSISDQEKGAIIEKLTQSVRQ
jgi:hypothetical protein